ncbi:uncharacterized protein KY384_003842 [Bacidia gigantensis]|uniref:uncharacterized protein n=1 Tax=Bacidia gigantensis TaxID=2732470 RepID=UPI001D04ACBC|nr:uncharacterized protein KY384_003842 [Bacidia gigantensis]KAG8532201.1 hypothetical protein KY384_003842 [Bacidia gigantensis]
MSPSFLPLTASVTASVGLSQEQEPYDTRSYRNRNASYVSLPSPTPATSVPLSPKSPSSCYSARPTPAYYDILQGLERLKITDEEGANVAQSITMPQYLGNGLYQDMPMVSRNFEGRDVTDTWEFVDPSKLPYRNLKRKRRSQSVQDERQHSEDSLKQFRVVKRLRSGSEGSCAVVKHKSTCEVFCMKIVRKPDVKGKIPWESYIMDVLDLAKKPHRNIIDIQWSVYNETCRIPVAEYYSEYFPVGDLFDFSLRFFDRQRKIPELFIWKVYRQLLCALEYLHYGFNRRANFGKDKRSSWSSLDLTRPGVVHRDIKPENILVRLPQGRGNDTLPDVVLTDFGHATLQQFTYDACGTPACSAPEMPRSSPKTDVWSVGAVIHFLIYGHAPIASLPREFTPTKENEVAWEKKPEARYVRTDVPEMYSEELVNAMLMALNYSASRRPHASQVVKFAGEEFREAKRNGRMKMAPLPEWAFSKDRRRAD